MWFYEVMVHNVGFISLEASELGDFYRMYRWRNSNRHSNQSLSQKDVLAVLNALTRNQVKLLILVSF